LTPSDLRPAACFPEGEDGGDQDSQDDVEELLGREADDFAVEEIASLVSSAGEGEEEPEEPPPLPPPAAAPEPAPVAPDAMPPPDVVLPLCGLMCYDTAVRVTSCLVCELPILKDSFRLDYRRKASTSLRDQRRMHATCLGRLPALTKASDVAKLARWHNEVLVGHAPQRIVDSLRA